MTPLNRTNKVLLAFSLPFSALYLFLVIPQVSALTTSLRTLDADRDAIGTGKGTQQAVLKQKLADLTSTANALLPASDSQADISVQVEALAKNVGVAITGFNTSVAVSTLPKTTAPASDVPGTASAAATPAPAAAPAGPNKVSIIVAVNGTYQNVENFIAGLTTLDRFIQIDQVSLTATAAGTLTAQITAYAYYQPGS